MYVIVHIWPDAGYGMPAPTIMPGPVYADYAEANQAVYDYCCGDDVGVREGHRYFAVELRAELPEPSYPSDAAYDRARALIAAEASDAGTAYCEECGKTPCVFVSTEGGNLTVQRARQHCTNRTIWDDKTPSVDDGLWHDGYGFVGESDAASPWEAAALWSQG